MNFDDIFATENYIYIRKDTIVHVYEACSGEYIGSNYMEEHEYETSADFRNWCREQEDK